MLLVETSPKISTKRNFTTWEEDSVAAAKVKAKPSAPIAKTKASATLAIVEVSGNAFGRSCGRRLPNRPGAPSST